MCVTPLSSDTQANKLLSQINLQRHKKQQNIGDALLYCITNPLFDGERACVCLCVCACALCSVAPFQFVFADKVYTFWIADVEEVVEFLRDIRRNTIVLVVSYDEPAAL